MSEYWKSTPNYWCKFCKTYVRDTKLERQQHEATGRHQSSIQRSLRNLHRDNEREERDKQRAKDEVARLNGIVSGTPTSPPSSRPSTLKTPSGQQHPASSAAVAPPPKVSLDERKSQMKQLADMGVAIPDQFRGDLALAGQWETVSERKVAQPEVKPEAAPSYGVRKRKLAEGEEEDENDPQNTDTASVARRRADWGSRYRSYQDTARDTSTTSDIEALLNPGSTRLKEPKSELAEEDKKKLNDSSAGVDDLEPKFEPSTPDDKPLPADPTSEDAAADDVAPVVFKKRKSKAAKVK